MFFPLMLLAQSPEEEVDPSNQSSTALTTGVYQTEKAQLIRMLKEEIEPNLLPADVRRIRRNIMRLGSFNAAWSKEAMDFLVANAPLVELFLYDYVRLQNSRLTEKIIQTLMQYESFQYPRAALFFSSEFLHNKDEASAYAQLVKHIVSKHPEVFEDYFLWMFSSGARSLKFVQKADFLQKACKAGAQFGINLRSQIDQWLKQEQELWSQLFLEEVRTCLKGL